MGIYELDKEKLKICVTSHRPLHEEGDQRPKDFAIDPSSANILFVLERYRPTEDEKAILGDWAFIAQVEDGKTVSAENLHDRKLKFEDDNYFRESPGEGSGPMFGSYALDSAKQPKRISIYTDDYGKREEEPKREYLRGIYKFDGDQLKIAYRKEGPPPEKFESLRGSGVTIVELQKKEPKSTISDSNVSEILQVHIDGPKQGVVGDWPSFKIYVKNGKTTPVKNIKVICSLSDSRLVPRWVTDKYKTEKDNLVWTIEVLKAGMEQLFEVRCSCDKPTSKTIIRVNVTSQDGDNVEAVHSMEILETGYSTIPSDPVTIPNLTPVNPGQR